MRHAILHFLILFVLFTHSTIAMDMHIPHSLGQSTDQSISNFVLSNDIDNIQLDCADAGAHCSHQQAHTLGLFTGDDLYSTHFQQNELVIITNTLTLFNQSPPIRPPKS